MNNQTADLIDSSDPFIVAGHSVYTAFRTIRAVDAKIIKFDDWLTARTPRPLWNAAEVIGDLASPETVALLEQSAVFGVTDHAPKVFGDDWGRVENTWREVCDRFLTNHPEQNDKGGNAFFFSEGELSGKIGRKSVPLCWKAKDKIQRVYAVQIDIDGGCTVEAVIARIRAMGIFAVIYTTHSHTTKGGTGSDRFRVIIPLAE